MTRKEKSAVKLLAAEAQRSLNRYPPEKSASIGISSLNYGINPTVDVMAELRRLMPGVRVSTAGFMGYVHFDRKAQATEAER